MGNLFGICWEMEKWEHQGMTNGNLQKHVLLVMLRLRENQNRLQHDKKSLHAKCELRRRLERRVMMMLFKRKSTIVYNHMNNFTSHT